MITASTQLPIKEVILKVDMKTSMVPVEVKGLRETKFSHLFENNKKLYITY